MSTDMYANCFLFMVPTCTHTRTHTVLHPISSLPGAETCHQHDALYPRCPPHRRVRVYCEYRRCAPLTQRWLVVVRMATQALGVGPRHSRHSQHVCRHHQWWWWWWVPATERPSGVPFSSQIWTAPRTIGAAPAQRASSPHASRVGLVRGPGAASRRVSEPWLAA